MIAISYRREDSLPVTGRLYDRLQAKFGKRDVFMDFDSIRAGLDFREQIKHTIERANVVIAMIGPHWAGEQPNGSRRIDDPDDFVRLEIAYALKCGIPVIPVLINNTPMPKRESLPPDIEGVVFRHALPLDSGLDFHQHTDRLISGICDVLPEGRKRRGQAMSADNLRLEIGHVLFIDIVGYSKLLVDEEAELVKELGDVVNNTEAARQAEARGQLIRLPSGDGMALVFTNSVEAPVKCALEMSAVLKNKPNLPLRMGVHSGPVQQVEDVNARTSLAGAGINLAQRVMDCGDAGHILLSKRVADDLAQFRYWQPFLHDLGECEVKPGVRLHLVNLYAESLGNAALPQKFQQTTPKPAADKPARRSSVGWVAALLLVALLAAGAAFYFISHRPATKGAAIPEKSIAVLPLLNSTGDPANEYFSDGISEEFISSLSRLSDLKVIGRTSSFQFKGTTDPSKTIGEKLGVFYLLEGSVRKSADRVRIAVALIKSRDGANVWSETYDRELKDIFAVQSEIAGAVAKQLKVALLGANGQSAQLTTAATPSNQNVEAYNALLQGNFYDNRNTAEDTRKAIGYYDEAIRLDPRYALAYARLSLAANALGTSYGSIATKEREEAIAKARLVGKRSVELDLNLAAAHPAQAKILVDLDFNFACSGSRIPPRPASSRHRTPP